MAGEKSALLPSAHAEAALTPEQRKYKQLVAKIEKARVELLAWQEQVPLFAQAHAQRMRPLMVELGAQRLQLLRRVDQLQAGPGLSLVERRTLRRALCELAAALSQSDLVDETTAAELEALHDLHAETSLDEERRAAVADMKGLIEAVVGLDLGNEAFESEEALMQRAQQKLRDEAERKEQHDAVRARRPARQTAAQRKREAEQQEASRSVREVFRKLASALHPDRASDEADRARRTALMQRVNSAYAAQDLLALFALQLEIEQVDAEHLAQASSERMRHYNRVLVAQLEELKDEIESQVAAFGMDFGVEPWRRLNPRKLTPLLDEEVLQIRAALMQLQRDLQLLSEPASTKRWIKKLRQTQAQDDNDPFDCPF